MTNHRSSLVSPKITPVLDPMFRPAALANREFEKELKTVAEPPRVRVALEQADGSMFHFERGVFPDEHPLASWNFAYIERFLKFLLWSRGGYRIHYVGPGSLHEQLVSYYRESGPGKFDAHIMGERVYERPFEIVAVSDLPPAKESTAPLGRHLDGCRIGFDLGGSDRKVAAVIDGKCVFSEEVVWDPIRQDDPQWHFDEIMASLKRAAAHMPRVDAIGGSAAGVYVNNRVKVASLFRGVPPDLFQSRVKDIFLEIAQQWGGIPFELANDGEVTALAGSMSLGANSVLGLAMGTSTAGGYVTKEGNITTWLNELAFTPVDQNPDAPVDEWSGDSGCGVQYFSQQAVGRLLRPAGIRLDTQLSPAEKLKEVQGLMERGDYRALKIYQTIGTYLGYGIAHYAEFYDIKHVLVLGRVTSGAGGDVIVEGAKRVLEAEFPGLAEDISFHMPDEKDRRHGQAIAAASLANLRR